MRDFTAAHHKRLIRLWKICIGEFVREASRAVAIDTGMSAASFMPLAARVRLATDLRSYINGAPGSRKAKPGYNSTAYPGLSRFKSRAHGENLGRRAYDIELGTQSNPRMVFEFNIVVLQYAIHETQSNWKSLQKGVRAFISTWNKLLPDYVSAEEINTWILTGDI